MKKINDYIIQRADSVNELNKKVRAAMSSGWQPIGGASYTGQPDWNYIQTMVKYSDDHGKYAQGCSTGPL